MTKELDCPGLACPAPVITTKEAVEKESLNELTVLVDNEAAKQNVSCFLSSQGFEVTATQEEKCFRVSGKRSGVAAPCEIMVEEKPAPECGLKMQTDRGRFLNP